jgi:antitoxin component YwqK of YwqJK toxin-antitoxin module
MTRIINNIIIFWFCIIFYSCSITKIPDKINQENDYGKQGLWITQSDSTKNVIMELYKSDIKIGRYIEYFGNGEIAFIGNYRKGKKNGIWEIYTEKGYLASKIKYRNGNVIKIHTNNIRW